MRGGYGDHLTELRQHRAVVDVGESIEECRNVGRIDGHQAPDLDMPLAQFAGDDAQALMCFEILDPQQIIGKPLAELSMNPQDELC